MAHKIKPSLIVTLDNNKGIWKKNSTESIQKKKKEIRKLGRKNVGINKEIKGKRKKIKKGKREKDDFGINANSVNK